jgi:hypothetical protein
MCSGQSDANGAAYAAYGGRMQGETRATVKKTAANSFLVADGNDPAPGAHPKMARECLESTTSRPVETPGAM